MHRFKLGSGQVVVLSTVHGLVPERDRVLAALDEERPDVLAIGLSPESVGTLLRYEPVPDVDPFDDLPEHDFAYSVRLAEFGKVELPAPDLLAALRWAQDGGIPSFGVDLTEEAYEDLFTKTVSVWGFLRYGRIQRRLARRPPRAPDARSFALAWDAKIRKVKGLRLVEAQREAAIAENVARLATERGGKVLLLAEVAREAGICERLRSLE